MKQVNLVLNPLRSPLAALLLAVFLGPIGVIYASVIGAVFLIFLLLVAYGAQTVYPLALVWLLGCFWSVIAVNRYNCRMIKKMGIAPCSEHTTQDNASGCF